MDPGGIILEELTFTNNHEGIEGFASKLTMNDRVVMESTGSVWTNLYNHLDARHIPVALANPLKTKAVASAKIKSDKVDARILAHLLRSNLVAESYVPPKHLREIRALIRHRIAIVKIRTRQALLEQFGQILLFGAGFDTRALRFQTEAAATRIFELDVPITQNAKIRQYQKRNLTVPPNTVFVSIDFDKESLPVKLDEAGFRKDQRSLFVLEGVTMYLQPKSVQETFETIREYAGAQSRVVFDYVRTRRGLFHSSPCSSDWDIIGKMMWTRSRAVSASQTSDSERRGWEEGRRGRSLTLVGNVAYLSIKV